VDASTDDGVAAACSDGAGVDVLQGNL